MAKKLYVGNLGYGISDSDLEKLFSTQGSVPSAQVIKDRDPGRSKGIGFVEMDNAEAGVLALHGKELEGRALVVNEAGPKEEGGRKGGLGGRGGFGDGRHY